MSQDHENAVDEASLPVRTWLDRLGASTGSPGGGAASAMMVAISAAMLAMVAGYSRDDARISEARERLVAVRRRALDLAAQDGRRSGELGEALRETGDDDAVPDAALTAARSVGGLGELAGALVPELELLLEVAARYLVPDLVVAAESAAAALGGAAATMRADLRLASAHGAGDDDDGVIEAAAAVDRVDAARRRIDELRRDAAERV